MSLALLLDARFCVMISFDSLLLAHSHKGEFVKNVCLTHKGEFVKNVVIAPPSPPLPLRQCPALQCHLSLLINTSLMLCLFPQARHHLRRKQAAIRPLPARAPFRCRHCRPRQHPSSGRCGAKITQQHHRHLGECCLVTTRNFGRFTLSATSSSTPSSLRGRAAVVR
jgi:hypothetical protein